MAQHDYNIANGGGAAVRADINNALTAIQSLNSGSTAPTATVAGMLWYDTATGTLKQRNAGNTAWVSAAELIGGGGQLAGMRNKIINGKMEIAQRGTSFAALVGGPTYTLDRFAYYSIGGAVTVSQQADAPSSNEFLNSLRVAVTTADTSIATTDITVIEQKIEGYNVRDLIGRTFTLSFWARSSKTGIHCASFRNSGLNRSYVAEYSINAANTWEYKTITVSGGLITAGTWDWTNGTGLYVDWALSCGTTFQTTAGAWQTGNFSATSNQVNCLDTVGNIFAITGVQLEVGGVATPFEHRPIGTELALCQRYYYRQQAIGTSSFFGPATNPNTTSSQGQTAFPVIMRTAPTGLEQTGTASHYQVYAAGVNTTCSAIPTFGAADVWGALTTFTVAAGLTTGQGAFLRSNNAAAYLGWSAEL